MAQPKAKQKEVIVKNKRGVDFQCSKQLKLMRGYMTKAQFSVMIMNEKAFQQKKKSKSGNTEGK